MNLLRMVFLFSLSMCSLSSFGAYEPLYEQLQIPSCLGQALSMYPTLAENKTFKIIEVPSKDINAIILLTDKYQCGKFVNVSHHFLHGSLVSKEDTAQTLLDHPPSLRLNQAEYKISHPLDVQNAFENIEPTAITQTLSHLTTYHNRSAMSKTGKDAVNWLNNTINNWIKRSSRQDVETYLVETGWYQQPSLVTVLGKDLKQPGIVLGAHIDTLDGRMPGAGDDGSGSATLLEIGRILLNTSQDFKRPIYLIWYAAEERGLVGSQFVVDHFRRKAIPVKAAIQFDMTGFRISNDPTLWVYEDYTDKNLTRYLVDLIQTYVKMPVKYSMCGYGCSDHASWTQAGIPAVFPCETSYEEHNPAIHTERDTMDKLSLEHMVNFTKLGLAFAIELAKD